MCHKINTKWNAINVQKHVFVTESLTEVIIDATSDRLGVLATVVDKDWHIHVTLSCQGLAARWRSGRRHGFVMIRSDESRGGYFRQSYMTRATAISLPNGSGISRGAHDSTERRVGRLGSLGVSTASNPWR
jgi:hypothetical protein